MYTAEDEFLNFKKRQVYFSKFKFDKKLLMHPSPRVNGPYKVISEFIKHNKEFHEFKEDMHALLDPRDPVDHELMVLLRMP